ncbi:MAG: lipoprotein-releasing ABC transporter permease subunit [Pseudomonadota bacterium]
MLRPLEIGIGLRYLRARRRTRFASFITLASMLGIAVGVAALIVILSVMNGFENELRGRMLGMSAHVTVRAASGALDDADALRTELLADADVVAAAPLTPLEGMIRGDGSLLPVLIEGIDPAVEPDVSAIANNLVFGELSDLAAGSRRLILGRVLALRLGVAPGDAVTVLLPTLDGRGVRPKLMTFEFTGMFEAGVQEHDTTLALTHIADAGAVIDAGGKAAAIRLLLADLFAAPAVTERLRRSLGDGYAVSDWTLENASYFRAVMLEKLMMTIMLSLIIAVAAFNIVASLVMVVTDKRTDIAILRTLGLKPAAVTRVFLTQGLVIGWFGALLGVALGVVLALNVPTIVPVLERLFGFQIMPGDVYVVTRIPSDLKWADVVRIAVMALALTGLATLYPARRAAAVQPAVALRYE